jgi:hypothetical protein
VGGVGDVVTETLPGQTMRTGGPCAFIALICTGEVCVRSTVSAET